MVTLEDVRAEGKLKDGVKPVFHRLEFVIHTPNGDVDPLFVIDMDIERNYIKNHFDVVTIQGAIPKGQFNYYVLPNKSKLEVTVRRIPLTEARHAVDDYQSDIRAQRYKATLYNDKSPVLEGEDVTASNINTADMADYATVKLQLQDPIIDRLRKQSVGGVYHDARGIDVVKYLLTKASRDVKVDLSVAVKGVTIANNSNTEVRKNIVIPHHTRFIDFPYLINRICGGIYSAGFHYYLQDRFWFLYAPFDITAYHQLAKQLINSNHEERSQMPNLIPLRVDMIVMAAIITDYVLAELNLKHLVLSTYDLKIGVLKSLSKP